MLNETADELDKIAQKKFDELARDALVATEAKSRIIMLEREITKEKEVLTAYSDTYEDRVNAILDLMLTSGTAEKIQNRQRGLGFIRMAPRHVMTVQSDALLSHFNQLLGNYTLEELHARTDASSEGSTEPTE